MIDANEAIQRVETVLKNAGINASKAQIWQVAHAAIIGDMAQAGRIRETARAN